MVCKYCKHTFFPHERGTELNMPGDSCLCGREIEEVPMYYQTFRRAWRERLAELRDTAPDMTVRELTDLYHLPTMQTWVRALQECPRETHLPLDVGRSLVAHLGHTEAGRMVRHVANFPTCLPRKTQKVS